MTTRWLVWDVVVNVVLIAVGLVLLVLAWPELVGEAWLLVLVAFVLVSSAARLVWSIGRLRAR